MPIRFELKEFGWILYYSPSTFVVCLLPDFSKKEYINADHSLYNPDMVSLNFYLISQNQEFHERTMDSIDMVTVVAMNLGEGG